MNLDGLLQQAARVRVSNLSVIPTSTRFIAALAAVALSFAMPVSAGELGNCAAEYTTGQGGLNCTANDDGGTVEAVNTPTFCVIGSGLAFDVETSFTNGTNAIRYDPRYWIAVDGGDVRDTAAQGGPAECSLSALTIGNPIQVTDEENNGDSCGDIGGNVGFPDTVIDNVTIDCIPDANGLVQFNTAVTWDTTTGLDCDINDLRVDASISKSQSACVETTLATESLGRVTVIKSAPDDDGSTDFVFNWTSNSPPQDPANQGLNPADPFFLADGGNQGILYALVTAGGSAVITITEQDPTALGYTLESIDCPGASTSPITNGVEVTLTYDVNNPALADVTCTFDNVAVQTNPDMSVSKSSTTGAIMAPGDVTYDYVVTNLGNVELTGVSLVDDNIDGNVFCPSGTVAIGDTMDCTATHTVTQAEIDDNGSPTPGSGMLSNIVTASSVETGNRTDNLDIPITQILQLTVLKSSPTSSIGAPQDVSYSYLVTNAGNTTLTAIMLVDDNITSVMTCPDTTLEPAAMFTCTATKTVTQGDVDNNGSPVAGSGELLNNVTASSAEAPDDTDSLSIPFVSGPAISVLKSSPTSSIGAPQDVSYSYLVTNTGNTTLTAIMLVDDNITSVMTCPDTTLEPAAMFTCTATKTVTQGDVDNNGSPVAGSGELLNNVTASSAEAPDDTDSLSIPFVSGPGISVLKSSSTTEVTGAGVVDYSYFVVNTGDVTLTGVRIDDDNDEDDASCTATTLAQGENTTCSATHNVTAGEVTDGGSPVAGSGFLVNNATAFGSSPGNTDDVSATDSLSIPFVLGLGISVVKSSTTTEVNSAGVVDYSYFVVNTGDVTLTGVRIDDDNDEDDASCTATTLAPGENTTCSATHNVTAGEITDGGSPVAGSGFLINNATAFGSSPDNTDDVSATDSLSIPFVLGVGIRVVKSSTTTEVISAGVVDYSYFVVNTGDVTLTGVRIDDDNDEDDASCTVTTLAPGENTTCSATHNVTAGEITDGGSPVAGSGFLVNNATAFGSSPDNTDDVSATASLSIPFVDRAGRFTVVKDFSDDNPGTVDVAISCNSGLPLQQEFTISEGHQVTFTVAGYVAGSTRCEITEVVPDGYTPDYFNGDVNSAVSCVYEDIPAGATFACLIYNELDPVAVTVTKEWEGVTADEGIDLLAIAIYECNNVREASDSLVLTSVEGSLNFQGETDSEVITGLYPDYGGSSYCAVTELKLDSAAEGDDSDCANLPISLGQGNSCTIYNTVFFEGIPTLNQYGLMLMALLMLAIGVIGFRRHM